MTFKWHVSPDPTFIDGFANYRDTLMNALYDLMVEEAARCETFMRVNAPWEDDCLPGKEYLKAFAFIDDEAYEVGIVAFYDQELYDRECGKRGGFPFGFRHELFKFSEKGVISVILPRADSELSVLGLFAEEVWRKVVALVEGGAAPSAPSVTDVAF